MESKFRNLRFNSEAEMNEWLKETTFKIIDLVDNGDDMQRIWVRESGEILNCDFHSSIYNGKFVDIEKLDVGNTLNIFDEEKQCYRVYEQLIIKAINTNQFYIKKIDFLVSKGWTCLGSDDSWVKKEWLESGSIRRETLDNAYSIAFNELFDSLIDEHIENIKQSKLSWKNIFNSNVSNKYLYNTIDEANKMAKKCGYELFTWNERIYAVDGKYTGFTEKDCF
jgi:hypothetical protein